MDKKIMEMLPDGVALSWGLEKQPKRGPKRELSIGQIVEAAISIADTEGLSAVSMSRVAASLGFTTMSLYRYIPSKDDLLFLMQDEASNIPTPEWEEDVGWRENLHKVFRANVGIFIEHPWFGEIPLTFIPSSRNTLKFLDWALGGIHALPFNEHEKLGVILLVSNYARGCGLLQRDINKAIQSGTSPTRFSGQDFSDALKYLVTADHFPNLYTMVASGAYTNENTEGDNVGDDFEFGFERVLDGIDHYLHSKKANGK